MGVIVLLTVLLNLLAVGDAEPDPTPPAVLELRELFEQDLIEFGQHLGDSLLICDPALCGEDYRSNQMLFRDLTATGGGHGYYPIADSLLPGCQRQRIGKSVTILWREGVGPGLTASTGYYRDECDSWSVCEIVPRDTTFQLPDSRSYEPMLLIRQGAKLPQSLRKCEPIKPDGDDVGVYQDSVTKVFRSIPTSRECPDRTEIVIFNYFAWSDKEKPDTLIATAHGARCYSGRWEAVYLLIQENGHWSWTPLRDATKQLLRFTVRCSFDLNSDGFPEFLISRKGLASLYTLIDGQLYWIASEMEHPC